MQRSAWACLLSLQEQADQSARNSDQGIFFQGLSPYGNELYYPPEVRMVRGAHMYSFCVPSARGLGWAGLGWAGLGWAGLGWAGLGWAGLGWH
jgi:hypothetical protein